MILANLQITIKSQWEKGKVDVPNMDRKYLHINHYNNRTKSNRNNSLDQNTYCYLLHRNAWVLWQDLSPFLRNPEKFMFLKMQLLSLINYISSTKILIMTLKEAQHNTWAKSRKLPKQGPESSRMRWNYVQSDIRSSSKTPSKVETPPIRRLSEGSARWSWWHPNGIVDMPRGCGAKSERFPEFLPNPLGFSILPWSHKKFLHSEWTTRKVPESTHLCEVKAKMCRIYTCTHSIQLKATKWKFSASSIYDLFQLQQNLIQTTLWSNCRMTAFDPAAEFKQLLPIWWSSEIQSSVRVDMSTNQTFSPDDRTTTSWCVATLITIVARKNLQIANGKYGQDWSVSAGATISLSCRCSLLRPPRHGYRAISNKRNRQFAQWFVCVISSPLHKLIQNKLVTDFFFTFDSVKSIASTVLDSFSCFIWQFITSSRQHHSLLIMRGFLKQASYTDRCTMTAIRFKKLMGHDPPCGSSKKHMWNIMDSHNLKLKQCGQTKQPSIKTTDSPSSCSPNVINAAIADSGATDTFVRVSDQHHLRNISTTADPLQIGLPNGQHIVSIGTG